MPESPRTNPTPLPLSRADYLHLYEKDIQPEHRPWYDRYLGIKPAGYWTHSDTNPDGMIVWNKDASTSTPRQLKAALARAIGCNSGPLALLAHEYGHALGLHHPPKGSARYWFDIMGIGLRCRDQHNLIASVQAWLDHHNLTVRGE